MSQFDASIPVLTEVLRDDPPRPAPAAADAAPAAGAEPAQASRAEPAPAAWPFRAPDAAASPPAPAEPEPLDWERLEREVTQGVLQQLNARVDFVLEQRLKDSMEEVLAHALHGLTEQIRAGLHDTIGKIVTRAVQQEITHLQASTPKPTEKR